MKNRRSTLFVDRHFQKIFLLYVVTAGIGVSIFYFAMFSSLFSSMKAEASGLGLAPGHVYFTYLDQQKAFFMRIFLTASLAFLGLIIVVGLYLSNRIVGPLHRLKSYLRDHRAGAEQGPLTFRKNDFFADVAEEVELTLKDARTKAAK